jgi:cytochrome c
MIRTFLQRRLSVSYAGLFLAGMCGIAISFSPNRVLATDPAEMAKLLVERAAASILSVGPQRALADITRPDGGFVNGDLYVFCTASDGTVLAHGGNPKLVGKNLSTVRDSEGTLPMMEITRVGQTMGQGWVAYLWPNPRTRHIERKTSFVIRIDDRSVCACGYYKTESQ